MEIKKYTENRTARMLGGLLAAGIGVTALTACGAEASVVDNVPGTVTGHEYRSAYDSFALVGKVMVPIYHPAEYYLDVQQCNRSGDKFADSNGCVIAEVEVSQTTYDQYKNGSTITFNN